MANAIEYFIESSLESLIEKESCEEVCGKRKRL